MCLALAVAPERDRLSLKRAKRIQVSRPGLGQTVGKERTNIAMARKPRPFIGMLFKCCNAYARIYLNKQGTAYVGFCPKCTKRVTIKAAPGGSSSRFWSAE
jgi:hypothetical protein